MNLREWCVRYVELFKANRLKSSTMESYFFACKLIPGELPIDVSELQLQELVNKLHDERKSNSTINHTLTIIRQALRKAYQLRMINVLPVFETLELPRSSARRVEAFTQAETERLINELLQPGRYNDVFLFLLVTGVRVGEALALRRSDVSFKERSITIERTNYRGTIQEPKTSAGFRTIPITAEARYVLRRRFWRTSEDLLFNFSYSTLRGAFKRVCERAEVAPRGIHALRHTYATTALRSGVSVKTLSALLGHSSTSITLDIYCSIELTDKQKEADKISFFPRTLQPASRHADTRYFGVGRFADARRPGL